MQKEHGFKSLESHQPKIWKWDAPWFISPSMFQDLHLNKKNGTFWSFPVQTASAHLVRTALPRRLSGHWRTGAARSAASATDPAARPGRSSGCGYRCLDRDGIKMYMCIIPRYVYVCMCIIYIYMCVCACTTYHVYSLYIIYIIYINRHVWIWYLPRGKKNLEVVVYLCVYVFVYYTTIRNNEMNMG